MPDPHRADEIAARLRAAGCVYAEDEAAILLADEPSTEHLEAMVVARCDGQPLELVVGWAEFCGLRLHVAPGVFIPRRRSELLVDEARALLTPSAVVVDLCCGVAPVAAALVAAQPGLDVHAADLDEVAVRCARVNLAGTGTVHRGDLYDALPVALQDRVDVLVVNAPYVPTGEIDLLPAEARLHEPRATLDGGADGLDTHRRVAAGAAPWLAPSGHLLIETSEHQAATTTAILHAAGFTTRLARSDDLDATVVIGASVSR